MGNQLGTLEIPTVLQGRYLLSHLGTSKSGKHDFAVLRNEAGGDDRYQCLLNVGDKKNMSKGSVFTNPTLAAAMAPVEGSDPANPELAAIAPESVTTPGGVHMYHVCYFVKADAFERGTSVLGAMSAMFDEDSPAEAPKAAA